MVLYQRRWFINIDSPVIIVCRYEWKGWRPNFGFMFSLSKGSFNVYFEVLSMRAQSFRDITEQGIDVSMHL